MERIIGEERATWITVSAGPRHAANGSGSRATSKWPFSLLRGFFYGPARPRGRRTQVLPTSWCARLMQVLEELTRGGPGQGPILHSAQGSPVLESRPRDPPPSQMPGAGGGGCGIPAAVAQRFMRAQLLLDGIPAGKGNTAATSRRYRVVRVVGATSARGSSASRDTCIGGEVFRAPLHYVPQARCPGPFSGLPALPVLCGFPQWGHKGLPALPDHPQGVLL